jgi:deoxyribodipyrimidine photo-lyase
VNQRPIVNIFWFRRDLRLDDNTGLNYALQSGLPVLPIFIFDTDILEALENKYDRRVSYIHQVLRFINEELKKWNSKLNTYTGKPSAIFRMLHSAYDIKAVFCNRDYEPQAIKRDKDICEFLEGRGIPFKAFKDQVIFDRNDILKNDGTPYTVYTPYAKKWRENLKFEHYISFQNSFSKFYQQSFSEIISLKEIGFKKTDILFDIPKLDKEIIDYYDKYRDYPAMQRTTQLGTALRFGTISIRKCVAFASAHNQTWQSELIWREFFMQILYHFPDVVHHAFKKQYDFIQWRNKEEEFKVWCEGKTGYPIVDAGIRQLNETGYMHNRVRMIAASFLCKHLLIDWRWGEAYFAQKLNDYDLSANNGNWQWVAGSGCDAAPYFRVFNPTIQAEKFDQKLEYIKKWVSEFGTKDYPKAMVEHSFARERALLAYKEAVSD